MLDIDHEILRPEGTITEMGTRLEKHIFFPFQFTDREVEAFHIQGCGSQVPLVMVKCQRCTRNPTRFS